MQLSLDAIGLAHGTDKASNHHGYLSFYDKFFGGVRQDRLKLLEIGVYGGASLKTWRDYFPNAEIVGADLNPSCRRHAGPRVQIEILDQSNLEEMTRLAVKHGPFDIVVEDGSHQWEHQITSLRSLYPFVKDGGFYVVEDLQTNYGAEAELYRGVASSSCVDYLKSWAELCCADVAIDVGKVEDAFLRTYGRAADYIAFAKRCCLIKKKYPLDERRVEVGSPLIDVEVRERLAVTAHVAGLGDIVGTDGYVNLPGEVHQLQGLAIDCEPRLEYRVLDANDAWSGWTGNGGFAGSRGLALSLKGMELRLSPEARRQWSGDVACRFSSAPAPVGCREGEPCLAPPGGLLCGVHVALRPRTAAPAA